MSKSPVEAGTKFLSLLLIVGGVAGVVGGLWGDVQTLRHTGFRPSSSLSIVALFILLFGCCVWVGVSLWRGRPRVYRWAKVLFTAQIPIVSVPGFSFSGFHTGLAVDVILSFYPAKLHFSFQLESAIHFLVSGEIENVLVGVNLVAVSALIYLFRVTSPDYGRKRDNFGLI
jgi:hypothetical protein